MHIRHHPLLPHSLGSSRELTSFHYGTPGAGPKAYIQASLHADELPGMLVAHHLRQRLAELDARGLISGEVVIVPVANPIGLAQWLLREPAGRFHLPSGENFNRHYPALADAVWQRVERLLTADAAANVQTVRHAIREAITLIPAATELASLRRTLLTLACDADIVLDLHCDSESVIHLYTGTPTWAAQGELLARCIGAEVSLLAETSGDDPFDEACSQLWWTLAARAGADRPIPAACLAATVELRGTADVSHALAAADAQALIDFLAHRGIVTGHQPPAPPPLKRPATPLAGSEPVDAPSSGVIAWLKSPGDWVEQGDVLAELIDPIEGGVTPLVSATAGLFYARESRRFATTGMRLAKVAGANATRTGKLMSP